MSVPARPFADADLSHGVDPVELPEGGMLRRRAGKEPALPVRDKGGCFAIGRVGTHYGRPLVEGIVAEGGKRPAGGVARTKQDIHTNPKSDQKRNMPWPCHR